ncbi:hypothetical protein M8J77_009487 [Diaphorina citri]|nr:hypothetical protein M8J77_009487 [Diaphorina citri]
MTVPKPAPTLDSLLLECGYQIKNYIILGYPSVLVVSFALSYIFITADLKYRCLIPECEHAANTSYLTPWLNHAVPYKDGYPQNCFRYGHIGEGNGCNPTSFNKSHVIKCNAWVFQTDEVNLLNEFNLECDENRWKLTIVGSIDGLGALLGSPFCAFISDKYGRRNALWLFSSACIVLGLVRSFSVNYYMYTILDFCNAVLDFGIFGTAFVLCMELVSCYHRVSANIILNLFCCSGYVLLGAVGIWIHDWKWVLRFLYGSGTLLFFYYWITPESMRWLAIKNRSSEAEQVAKNLLKKHPQIQHVDLKAVIRVDKELDPKEVNVVRERIMMLFLAFAAIPPLDFF